jgi:hypothetical protein
VTALIDIIIDYVIVYPIIGDIFMELLTMNQCYDIPLNLIQMAIGISVIMLVSWFR